MSQGYYYDEKVPPDHENPEHGFEYNSSCHCNLCKRIRESKYKDGANSHVLNGMG